jgi:hypothetical protein
MRPASFYQVFTPSLQSFASATSMQILFQLECQAAEFAADAGTANRSGLRIIPQNFRSHRGAFRAATIPPAFEPSENPVFTLTSIFAFP